MSNPVSNLHIDRYLTNFSVGYIQDASASAALQALTQVPVQNRSDKYVIYRRADFFKSEMKLRAADAAAALGGYGLDTDNFTCSRFALAKIVTDEDYANSDSPLDARKDAAAYILQQGLLKREADFASNFMASGTSWGAGTITGVASAPSTNEVLQWSDVSSDPITDIENGKGAILEGTGKEANKLILGYNTYKALKKHPLIIDRIKYTQNTAASGTRVDASALANLFEVDKVIVSKVVQNSAVEGDTESNAFVVGKAALLVHAPDRAGLFTPTAFASFNWEQFGGASGIMRTIDLRQGRNSVQGDQVEGELYYAQKQVATSLGYYWKTIVA